MRIDTSLQRGPFCGERPRTCFFFYTLQTARKKSSISVSLATASHSATCAWFAESVRNSTRKAAIGFAGDVARRAAGEKEVVFFHCDVGGQFFRCATADHERGGTTLFLSSLEKNIAANKFTMGPTSNMVVTVWKIHRRRRG